MCPLVTADNKVTRLKQLGERYRHAPHVRATARAAVVCLADCLLKVLPQMTVMPTREPRVLQVSPLVAFASFRVGLGGGVGARVRNGSVGPKKQDPSCQTSVLLQSKVAVH